MFHYYSIQLVLKVLSDSLVVLVTWKDEWRFATTTSGVLSVITDGTSMMPEWRVGSLDFLVL